MKNNKEQEQLAREPYSTIFKAIRKIFVDYNINSDASGDCEDGSGYAEELSAHISSLIKRAEIKARIEQANMFYTVPKEHLKEYCVELISTLSENLKGELGEIS